MQRALIISDGKPGHFNQSIALCRHLDLEYEILEVVYRSRAAKALSYLLDRLGIYTASLLADSSFTQDEVERGPTVVGQQSGKLQTSPKTKSREARRSAGSGAANFKLLISTGSTTYYTNKLLARQLKIPNIAILYPRGYRLDFTHILCPAYDHPPQKANVTEIPLNLCAAEPAFFEDKAVEFRNLHTPQKPSVGIIIGGPNAVSDIDTAALKSQLEQIFSLTEGMERWVTTSRRTPREVEAVIESMPFDYTLINSRDPYNPIPAFIQLCDRLFVTSDSASMISECASFGTAHVEILMNRQLKSPNKFEELVRGLAGHNAVHVFDGTLGDADTKIDLTPVLSTLPAPI